MAGRPGRREPLLAKGRPQVGHQPAVLGDQPRVDGPDRRRQLDPDRLAEGGGGAGQPRRAHRLALRRDKVGEIRGRHRHGVPVVVRQLQVEGLP